MSKQCSLMSLPATLLLFSCLVFQIYASDPIFYEPFDQPFAGRWIVSEKDDYKGVWKHSKSEGHDDFGLLVREKARKHAIAKVLDQVITLKDKTVILQFETRFQDGLECGGAYLKYLRPQQAGWKPEEFDNTCPYSIMFGPDKCGSTNKVHFIFQHKNPKTAEFVEHHLKYPPSVPSDKLSHVYTAIITPDNEVKVLIDGEEKKKVNIFSDDFDPPLLAPKTIPDPDDKKPSDWDDRSKISDPDAEKPDDWDEDAAMEIEDEAATKPEGWLDDEPDEIDDPEATKPEDWDDEEDGEWEAPKVENPKCAGAPGCGEWKRPMMRNPDFKGKWHAPLIDNPDYKGIWKARDIPNPNYFELDHPNFEDISAVGIEIWTMQDGILFDNILIADDDSVAKSYREMTWKVKYQAEKAKQDAEEATPTPPGGLTGVHKAIFDKLHHIANAPFLRAYKPKIEDVLERAEQKPNLTVGVLISAAVVVLTLIIRSIFAGKKPAAAVQVSPTPEGSDRPADEVEEDESAGKDESEVAAPRKRQARKEN